MLVIDEGNLASNWARAVEYVSQGMRQIQRGCQRMNSRAGPVRVWPTPVTTIYRRPCERVLLDPHRDANPFFHLFEALWMLAGRDDATYLDKFVGDYSARFAEPNGRQHGAYGKRWRYHFVKDDGWFTIIDQLDEVVRLLREDHTDRQAVLTMWDPSIDLGVPGLKDRPCNSHAYLRVHGERGMRDHGHGEVRNYDERVLDLTVCCRSNDLVWGCYGANAVHFSMLLEYLAARIGVGVGTYYQVSNNWHVYDATVHLMDADSARATAMWRYPGALPLVTHPESFDNEVRAFVSDPGFGGSYKNEFLLNTAQPMFRAHALYREKLYDRAWAVAHSIEALDWRAATVEWLQRRITRLTLRRAEAAA